MRLVAKNISKRFDRQWVFRALSFEVATGEIMAIKGANGSGKSTLMAVLSLANTPNKGEITYFDNEELAIDKNHIGQLSQFVAPYLELPEQLSLDELLNLHETFNHWEAGRNKAIFYDNTNLGAHKHKRISQYSSGMKQRVQLGLAFHFRCEFLFLDEPTATLDLQYKAWYQRELQQCASNRLILIASNDPLEYQQASKGVELASLQQLT